MRLIGTASTVFALVLTAVLLGLFESTPEAQPLSGRDIFRFDTFGDEQLWTGVLRMHEVVAGQRVGARACLQHTATERLHDPCGEFKVVGIVVDDQNHESAHRAHFLRHGLSDRAHCATAVAVGSRGF